MTGNTIHHMRALVLSCLERQLAAAGFVPEAIPSDFDFRTEGVIDSLGFVQLIADMEARLGFGIDLTDLDPEELTILGSLARHIALQQVAFHEPAS